MIFEHAEQEELVLEELPGAVHVHIRGTGQKLLEFSNLICERFPVTNAFQNWRDVLMDMTDDFALRGADGQLAYLKAYMDKEPEGSLTEYTLYGAPEITEEQKSHFPEGSIQNHKAGKKVWEHNFDLPWEADTFEQIIREEIIPALRTGDIVRIEGALS